MNQRPQNRHITRKEAETQILDRGFTTAKELLDLEDYFFEQWCARTAKGAIPSNEMRLLDTDVELAERWIDGLRALLDSSDTQIEHADAELEAALDAAESLDTDESWAAYAEVEQRQEEWRLKINTFIRRVRRTLRTAERNLNRLRRQETDPGLKQRVVELEEAIRAHYDALSADPDDGLDFDEVDLELWKVAYIFVEDDDEQ